MFATVLGASSSNSSATITPFSVPSGPATVNSTRGRFASAWASRILCSSSPALRVFPDPLIEPVDLRAGHPGVDRGPEALGGLLELVLVIFGQPADVQPVGVLRVRLQQGLGVPLGVGVAVPLVGVLGGELAGFHVRRVGLERPRGDLLHRRQDLVVELPGDGLELLLDGGLPGGVGPGVLRLQGVRFLGQRVVPVDQRLPLRGHVILGGRGRQSDAEQAESEQGGGEWKGRTHDGGFRSSGSGGMNRPPCPTSPAPSTGPAPGTCGSPRREPRSESVSRSPAHGSHLGRQPWSVRPDTWHVPGVSVSPKRKRGRRFPSLACASGSRANATPLRRTH